MNKLSKIPEVKDMKIIHCADIHLDSPLQAHLSRDQAARRNAELTQTFLELIRYAQQEHVDLVLIAGDLFDENRVSRQTLDMVFFAMEQAADVDFLYLPGNHGSQVLARHRLPKNLRCFSDTWQGISYGPVSIWGLELTKENALRFYDELNLPSQGTNIVALHGQVATAAGEGLIHLGRLKGKNIDYLARGHIHRHRLEQLDNRGQWAYCGCLEGRGCDETGSKGFVLLDAGLSGVKAHFIPFARRCIHAVDVDITGLQTNSQVYTAIQEKTAHIPEEDLVRVNLAGKKSPQAEFSRQYLQQLLERCFFSLDIKDCWQLDTENFVPEISLKGAFVRLALEQDLPDQDKQLLIRMGLQALAGEELTL